MLKKNPLVSICIPVYNNSDYIVETMESVLNQTYKNIELIVVDDNSKDNSLELIRSASNEFVKNGMADMVYDLTDREIFYISGTTHDPANKTPLVDFERSNIPELPDNDFRIIYIYHNDKNLGMSGNWNRSMELCRGEYIKLICADDQIHSSLVEREVNAMQQNPEIVLVESDTEFRNKANKPSGSYSRYGKGIVDGKKVAHHSLFSRDYFGAPLANLIRTSAYKELGGIDPTFSYIVDYDFYMKLACHGLVYVIREPLNYFRIREDSNTGEVLGGDQGNVYVAEHRKLVEKYAPVLGLSKRQIERSVRIRKFMSFLGGIYLKLKLRK